ncbi:kinesin [Novosphingobium sp. TCA1]|uniref:kinesin n=1 Tax=Novosphingobium sp. TCA1 TaxID=2682474 RepID=UPI0013090CEB|nr:kinesin [Novosphingobium sp. TCA1]GFE72379.1 hypothetical protein NTCA1_00280 [Novosphingobium sp. TCA1]
MTKTIEELQADLDKAFGSISRLEAKNSELIDREKAERTRAEAAEKLADEAEANAAAGNELKTLQRDYKKLETALASITSERDTLAGELKTTRVDSAISAAIASGNVRPEMVEAVEALMHRRVEYADGEASIAGKSIADYAKGFFAKDGAHYVRAADNSGADSQGNNGSKASGHGFTKETYNHGAYAGVYIEEGVEVANAIADEVGRPDLKTDA